jgi:hypothetical protein
LLLRGFFAAPVELFAVGLRVPVERLVPDPEDLARVEADFFAPPARDPLELFADDLRAPPLLLAPPDERVEEPELLPESSLAHLPDITR